MSNGGNLDTTKEFPVQRRAVKGALIVSGLIVAVCLLGMPSLISCLLVAGIVGIVAFEFSRWPRTVIVDENELRVSFCLWVKKACPLKQLEVRVIGEPANVAYSLKFFESGTSKPMFKIDRAHSGIQIDLLQMELVARGVKVFEPDCTAKSTHESRRVNGSDSEIPVVELKEGICSCCGYKALDREGSYNICPVCWWEDDPVQRKDPEFAGGSNEKSLSEARVLFAEHGVSDVRFIDRVRKARVEEGGTPA